jgi:hypothetical protein
MHPPEPEFGEFDRAREMVVIERGQGCHSLSIGARSTRGGEAYKTI